MKLFCAVGAESNAFWTWQVIKIKLEVTAIIRDLKVETHHKRYKTNLTRK